MTHTPEPWHASTHGIQPASNFKQVPFQDYARACKCVNALSGVENPAVLRIRHDQMLRSVITCPRCKGAKGFDDTTYDRTGEWCDCEKCDGRGQIVDQSKFFTAIQ